MSKLILWQQAPHLFGRERHVVLCFPSWMTRRPLPNASVGSGCQRAAGGDPENKQGDPKVAALKVHDGRPSGWFRSTAEADGKQVGASRLGVKGRTSFCRNVCGGLASIQFSIGFMSKGNVGWDGAV
jgi:hypothetical protein